MISNMTMLRIENFMSIKEADIDISDSIIDLCGYNDSGKSAIQKALEILMYDSYSTKQVRFIKNGESYFHIKLEFDDGVSVSKTKLKDGTNIWELTKDNQIIYTNKVGKAYAAVNGVPAPIADYMMVLKDDNTKEKLNVRKKDDKLFLIQTTGGENYKVLNEILKADVLANASKMMNEDRLKLQAELIRVSTKYDTLKEEYEDIHCVSEENLNDFESKADNLVALNDRYKDLSKIANYRRDISKFGTKPKLEIINLEKMKGIYDIARYGKIASISIKPEVNNVSDERLKDIRGIVNQRRKLDDYDIGDKVDTVDTSRLQDIVKLAKLFNEIYAHNNVIKKIDVEVKKAKDEANKIITENNLRVCKNCGALVD